jgi:hypothetical protein
MDKIRRPTAADYINTSILLHDVPTYDEFMEDLKKQWQDQFTEAERLGVNGNAPISFYYYINLSMETIKKQIEEIIPQKYKEGTLSAEDAAASTELLTILLSYEERALREKNFF